MLNVDMNVALKLYLFKLHTLLYMPVSNTPLTQSGIMRE